MLSTVLRLKRGLEVLVTEDVPKDFSDPPLMQKSGSLAEENWNQETKHVVPIMYQLVVTDFSNGVSANLQNNKEVQKAPEGWKEKTVEN